MKNLLTKIKNFFNDEGESSVVKGLTLSNTKTVLLVSSVAVLALVVTLVLGVTQAYTVVEDSGYAVSKSANIKSNLVKGESELNELTEVKSDDLIYSNAIGYYLGESKVSIDKDYPLIMNDGLALRFLDESNYLVSSEAEIYETFEGLYLQNGKTYNSDRVEADLDEFILLSLDNGLYMNAQEAKFTNLLGEKEIKINSILYLSENAIRWYSEDNGCMVYSEENSTYDATISIGSHTYYYSDLLKALSILKDAEEDIDDNKDAYKKIEEAHKILVESEKKYAENSGGNSGNVETESGEGGSGEGDVDGETSGTDGETGTGTGISDGKTHEKKEGESEKGQSENTGESKGGVGEGETGETGEKTEGEGENDEVSEKKDGEAGTSDKDTEGGAKREVKYIEPKVTFTNINEWSYAIFGNLNIYDPSGVISKGVKIYVYSSKNGSGASYVNEEGFTEYEPSDGQGGGYSGGTVAARLSYTAGGDISLTPLPPDETLYIQIQYTYDEIYYVKSIEKGKEVSVKKKQRKTYKSSLIEVHTTSAKDEAGVIATWEDVFANETNALYINGLKLTNVEDYDSEADFSFENEKKNLAKYVNKLEFEFKKTSGLSDTVTGKISSSTLLKALDGSDTSATLPASRNLDSNTEYTYTVKAYDKWNNEIGVLYGKDLESAIPLDDVENTIYTKKEVPSAKLEVTSNKTNELIIKFTFTDTDGSLKADNEGNIGYINVKDYLGAATELIGTLDGEDISIEAGDPIPLKAKYFGIDNTAVYTLKLTNLFSAQTYYFTLKSLYDPQPTLKADDEVNRLQTSELTLINEKAVYTASMDGATLIFSTRIQQDSDGNEMIGAHYVNLLFTVSKETTTSAIYNTEMFRLTMSDGKDEAFDFSLTKDEINSTLNSSKFNSTYNGFEFKAPTYTSCGVYLVYTEYGLIHKAEVKGKYWENIFPQLVDDELQDPIFEILIVTPNTDSNGNSLNYLKSYTTYNLRGTSYVTQTSGGAKKFYSITTKPSLTRINTLREEAKVLYDDLYIGSGRVTFSGLRVYDPDGAVRNNGNITITLSKGENILDEETITATSKADSEGTDIEFTDIKKGSTYILEIKADAYSEAVSGGTISEKTLYYNNQITGSGSLSTTFSLSDLTIMLGDDDTQKIEWTNPGNTYDSFYKSFSIPSELSGSYISEAIKQSKDSYTGNDKRSATYVDEKIVFDNRWYHDEEDDYYYTEYLTLPSDAKYIRFEYLCDEDAEKEIFFYDENGELIPLINNTVDDRNTRIMSYIPDNAKYVSFGLYNPVVDEDTGKTFLEENGLEIYYHKSSNPIDYFESSYFEEGKEYLTDGTDTENENIASIKLAVVPGQIYLTDAKCEVSIYSNTMSYMGSTNKKVYNSPIEIPQNGGYLVINYEIPEGETMNYDYHLWLVSNSSDDPSSKKYEAILKLNVLDSLEYLVKDGVGLVNMIVEVSDTIENPDYEEKISLSKVVEITTDDLIEEYTYLKYINLEDLPSASKFRITLTADIKGEMVTLNQIEFSTDTSYILIHNNRELDYISYYPFGNFLVVDDFEHYIDAKKVEDGVEESIKFYGTIDFQGHTITRSSDSAGRLFQYNYGTIKNLVYYVPEDQVVTSSVIYENRGTIDGFILESGGDIELGYANSGTITQTNYGIIENFIVELKGYTVIKEGSYGLIAAYNYGDIKDGYIYSKTGYGVIFRGTEVEPESEIEINPSLICYSHKRGTISNIYIVSDVYYSEYLENHSYIKNLGTICPPDINSDFKNVYWVGEEYIEYDKGDNQYVKSKSDTYKYDTLLKKTYSKANISDVWHIFRTSEFSYEIENSLVKQTYWAQLRDIDWQVSILGDQFNATGNTISDNIGKGYYPRLSLSEEMEGHQEYLKLPVTDINMQPIILSDSWTNSVDYDNEKGYITLNFYNPNRATITEITIEHLGTFTIDGHQALLNDGSYGYTDYIDGQAYENGVWKVTLFTSVDESEDDGYLSSYTVTSFKYLGSKNAIVSGYKTTGFEFWKKIDHVSGSQSIYKYGAWTDIDEHKNWNYKIVADLDFTGYSDTDIRIYEGTDTAIEGDFTGKIDGLDYDDDENEYYHRLSNIDMTGNVSIPSVITSLGVGGVVENLIIENMNIKSSITPTIENVGFIGSAICTDNESLGYIDNVHIVASSVTGFGNVGLLVGYANGTTITNCSAADYTLEGESEVTPLIVTDISNLSTSYYGGLLGYGVETLIRNSYVRNLDMSLSRGKNILGVGGIAGYLEGESAEISNCYTTGSISVTGENIGGIVGSIEEESYLHIDNCWSNVLLDVKGTHVGGVAGRLSYEVNNNIALGSIFVTDETYSHRITGTLPSTGELHRTYAYEAQYVTGKTENDPDGAFRLISKEQLRLRSTWKDLISIGDYYDVRCVSGVTRTYNGNSSTYYLFPKLYSTDGKTYVWGQTGTGNELSDGDISLPGVSGEHTFEIDQALYTNNGKSDYMVVFKIHHPGITYDEYVDPDTLLTVTGFKQMVESGQVSITIPGLGLTKYKGDFTNNEILQTGEVLDANSEVVMSISLSDGTLEDDNATIVTIHTSQVYSFYSLYRLEVEYKDFNRSNIDLLSDVQFLDEYGEPIEQWIEISNWYEWCYYIVGRDSTNGYKKVTETDPDFEAHGKTLEKVRITGKIDMSEMQDIFDGKYGDIYEDFISLQFDILEGQTIECGFYGNGTNKRFSFNTTKTGEAFIEYIKTEIRNLTFEDVYVNLNNPSQTSNNSISGLILKAQLVNNINITNVNIETNRYTNTTVGFFGRVMSSISNVNMESVTLKSMDDANGNGSSVRYYAGTLAGEVYDSVNFVNANNLTVSAAYVCYAAGLVGKLSCQNSVYFTSNNEGCLITNVKVTAMQAGGIFGWTGQQEQNFTLDGFEIEATGSGQVGVGCAGYACSAATTLRVLRKTSNITIKNGTIHSPNGIAAGIYRDITGYQTLYYVTVENVKITGGGNAGGVIGYPTGTETLVNINVLGCEITSTDAAAGGIAAQGVARCNYYTVRDTNITGYTAAGGVVGISGNYGMGSQIYVAEDVTVTSKTNYAGGVVGYWSGILSGQSKDICVGATVVAEGNYAGGIFGYIYTTYLNCGLQYSYFTGTVKGNDYVGGFIGGFDNYYNSGTTRKYFNYNGDLYSKNIFAGTIVCEGEHYDVFANKLGTEDSLPEVEGYTTVWDEAKHTDKSSMYIWNEAVVNGNIVREEDCDTKTIQWLSTDDFRLKRKISNILTTNRYYYDCYDVLETYMPFIKVDSMNYQWEYNGESVGILLPGYGTNKDLTTIYASDVDKLNIETSVDKIYVKIEGMEGSGSFSELDTSDGVATFKYDFMHNVTIGTQIDGDNNILNGKTYTPDELRNTVMVDGDDWFAIDESQNETGELGGTIINTYEVDENELPRDFTKLDYIEGTGTQWIDTGVRYDYKTMTISLGYMITEYPESGFSAVYGSYGTYHIYSSTTGSAQGNYLYHNIDNRAKPTLSIYYAEEVKADKVINSNGTMGSSGNHTYRSSLYIFNAYDYEAFDYTPAKMRLYGFIIYENGEEIRNFIPAKSNITGEVGLYEVCENKFYTSESDDDFIESTTNFEKHDLPEEYTEVEFIKSSGTQVIDTNVTPTLDYTIEVKAIKQSNTSLFGSGNTGFTFTGSGNNHYAYIGNGKVDIGQIEDGVHIWKIQGRKAYCDDISSTKSSGTGAITTTLTLFCRHASGTSYNDHGTHTIYYVKIWDENNVLVREMYPCVRNSDNVLGMYDKVNGVFYTNIGTGSFTTSYTTTYNIKQAESNVYADKALKVVHLWQGKALTTDGEIYTLVNDGQKVVATYTDTVVASASMIDDQPIYETTYSMEENIEGEMDLVKLASTYEKPEGTYLDSEEKYLKVDYIRSTGTQYIDTGVRKMDIGTIEIQYKYTGGMVILSNQCNYSRNCFVMYAGWSNSIHLLYGTINIDAPSSVRAATKNNVVTQKITDTTWTITNGDKTDSIDISNNGNTNETVDNNTPLVLFACEEQQSTSYIDYLKYNCSADLYYLKYWDNDNNLIRDFVPAINVETGKAGLYDLVQGRFYVNEGASDFETNVTLSTQCYDNRYVKLDYIATTGTQYIDTEYHPTNGLSSMMIYQNITDYSDLTNKAEYLEDAVLYGVDGSNKKDIFYQRIMLHANGYRYLLSGFDGIRDLWYFGGVPVSNSGYETSYINSHYIKWYGRAKASYFYIGKTNGYTNVSTLYDQSDYSIYISCVNHEGTPERFTHMKFYGATIWEWDEDLGKDVVVRNYVPAIDTVTSEIGIFDTIERKFYGNAGTGEFEYETTEHLNSKVINQLVDSEYDVTVEMYKNFSKITGTIMVGGEPVSVSEKIDYRLYVTKEVGNDTYYQYLQSPWEDTIYDSVIYKAIYDSENDVTNKYIASLTSGGTLQTSFNLNGLSNTNITEISNSLTANDGNNLMVIKYKNGTLAIYDYVNEEVVYRQHKTFWSYASHIISKFSSSITSFFSSKNTIATSNGTTLDSTGLYRLSKEVAITSYTETLSGNAVTIGEGTVTLNATGEGTEVVLTSGVYMSGNIYDLDGNILYANSELEMDNNGVIRTDDGKEYQTSLLSGLIPSEVKDDITTNVEGSSTDPILFLVSKEESEVQESYTVNTKKIGKSESVVNVYDPVTGERTDVDTGELFDNETGSITELVEDGTDEEVKRSIFNVNYDRRHLILDENEEGFILIGVVGITAVIILIVLGLSLKKRKKINK